MKRDLWVWFVSIKFIFCFVEEGNKLKLILVVSNIGFSILFVIEEFRFFKIIMGYRRSFGIYCKLVLVLGI